MVRVKIGLPVSDLKSKINFFYLLAIVPLVLILYNFQVSGRSILGSLIPFYGFFLLFLKKDRLSQLSDAGRLQRFVGLVVILASLFVFYGVLSFSSSALYGAGTAFYAVFILGLLLVFFGVHALRESFSDFFIIVCCCLIL